MAFHHSIHFPLRIPLRHILPLVIILFAAGKGQIHLHKAMLKIEFQRNKGETFLLHFAGDTLDFLFMQQKLPWPQGVMVIDVAVIILTYVQLIHHHVAAFCHLSVGVP